MNEFLNPKKGDQNNGCDEIYIFSEASIFCFYKSKLLVYIRYSHQTPPASYRTLKLRKYCNLWVIKPTFFTLRAFRKRLKSRFFKFFFRADRIWCLGKGITLFPISQLIGIKTLHKASHSICKLFIKVGGIRMLVHT